MAVDTHQYAGSKPKRYKGGSAITEEWKRNPNHWKKSCDHADIYKRIGEENHTNGTP